MENSNQELAQKLCDNTIGKDEVDKLKENLRIDDIFKNNFYMNFLTPLFFKNFSNITKPINNITKNLPDFITSYIKFCLYSSFEYFFTDDESKNDFYHQLYTLIHLLIENKVINIDKIINLLNNVSQLNLDFARYLLQLLPQIKQKSPKTIENIEKFNSIIHKYINDPQFCLDVAWPSVTIGDTNNPRISKFGGVQPFLPEDGLNLCSKCHSKSSMVCQIYIPTTPEWFQAKFPPEKRNSLIVVLYCNFCYLNIDAKFYTEGQLNSLVYDEDVIFPGVVNYTFNEPRIVTGWTSGKMMPIMGNSILNELASLNSLHYEELDTQFQRFNSVYGPKENNGTYIGGWPEFVQDDSTPPDSFLVINLSESKSSTAMWGDAGTAQIWMKNPINDCFGELVTDWACC